MFDFWPIYKRELKAYFNAPSTYVVLALLFLINGVLFVSMMSDFSIASESAGQYSNFGMTQEMPNVTEMVIRSIFEIAVSLLMFIIPLLSMRLVAEEKKEGTFELLVTCPIGDWSILMGKYLALVSLGVLIVAATGLYPLTVWWVGLPNQSSPEWPVVISCAVGLLLIFSCYSAFGLMASSFTESQITAAVITLVGLLIWYVLGALPVDEIPYLRDVLRELSAAQHTENFIKGVLVLKDFVFYGLASFIFLFIASKTLEARRWRV